MSRVLGLQVVVEGTVQTVGQHIRISVRLTGLHSGKLIWAEAYAISAPDSGEAQVDIAPKIAAQIGRCLLARCGPASGKLLTSGLIIIREGVLARSEEIEKALPSGFGLSSPRRVQVGRP